MLAGNASSNGNGAGDADSDGNGKGDSDGGPLERIRQLLTQRIAAYSHAHYAVATDDLTSEKVACTIMEIYAKRR